MSLFDLIVLIAAVIVSADIVRKANVSNLHMLWVVPAVILAGYLLIFVLKLALLMLLIIIVGLVVLFLLYKLSKV
jgi:hypothetical protein